MFELNKKKYMELLYKPDKSKKGNVDEQISYFIDYINSLDDYYTTSSCAGRIVVVELEENSKKHEVNWIFSSHDLVEKIDLSKLDFNKTSWFRQESFIMHICARDMDAANKLLQKAKECGLKRSGIIGTSKRIMVEILGTENIAAPVYDNEILISQKYMDYLVQKANIKLTNTREKAKKLFTSLQTSS